MCEAQSPFSMKESKMKKSYKILDHSEVLKILDLKIFLNELRLEFLMEFVKNI